MKKEIPLQIKLLLFVLFVYAALILLRVFSQYFVLAGILFLEGIAALLVYGVLLFLVLLCIYGVAWRKRWSFMLVLILFMVVLVHEVVCIGIYFFLHPEIANFLQQFMLEFSLSGVKTIFIVKKVIAILMSVYVIWVSCKFKQYFSR